MVDLRSVFIDRLRMAWRTIDFTIADLSDEQLHHRAEGAQLGTPASIYLHHAWVEDMVVNQMLQSSESVYDSQGWSEKLPGAPVHRGASTFEWAWSVRVPDSATLNAYAAAVRPTVISYISGLGDDDFDRMVPWFTGDEPLSSILSYLIWDVANHTGEIAALRGLAGMKGLPF